MIFDVEYFNNDFFSRINKAMDFNKKSIDDLDTCDYPPDYPFSGDITDLLKDLQEAQNCLSNINSHLLDIREEWIKAEKENEYLAYTLGGTIKLGMDTKWYESSFARDDGTPGSGRIGGVKYTDQKYTDEDGKAEYKINLVAIWYEGKFLGSVAATGTDADKDAVDKRIAELVEKGKIKDVNEVKLDYDVHSAVTGGGRGWLGRRDAYIPPEKRASQANEKVEVNYNQTESTSEKDTSNAEKTEYVRVDTSISIQDVVSGLKKEQLEKENNTLKEQIEQVDLEIEKIKKQDSQYHNNTPGSASNRHSYQITQLEAKKRELEKQVKENNKTIEDINKTIEEKQNINNNTTTEPVEENPIYKTTKAPGVIRETTETTETTATPIYSEDAQDETQSEIEALESQLADKQNELNNYKAQEAGFQSTNPGNATMYGTEIARLEKEVEELNSQIEEKQQSLENGD